MNVLVHGYVREMSFKRKATNKLLTQERFNLIMGHWGTNPGHCGAIGIAEKRSKSLPCMKHQLLSIMIVGEEGSVCAMKKKDLRNLNLFISPCRCSVCVHLGIPPVYA